MPYHGVVSGVTGSTRTCPAHAQPRAYARSPSE